MRKEPSAEIVSPVKQIHAPSPIWVMGIGVIKRLIPKVVIAAMQIMPIVRDGPIIIPRHEVIKLKEIAAAVRKLPVPFAEQR